jgi:hypothetical protein
MFNNIHMIVNVVSVCANSFVFLYLFGWYFICVSECDYVCGGVKSTICLSQVFLSNKKKKKTPKKILRRTFGKRECKRWYFCNLVSIKSKEKVCVFFFFCFSSHIFLCEVKWKTEKTHKLHSLWWCVRYYCRKLCKLNVCGLVVLFV